MDPKILRNKRFWAATFLIAWAAALQAHMTWMQRQASFQEKFGKLNEKDKSLNEKDKKSKQPDDLEVTELEAIQTQKQMDSERLE